MEFEHHADESQVQDVPNGATYWQQFVNTFFADDSVFKLTVISANDPGAKPKQFTICYTSLPRYYVTHFESGVENIQLTMDGATEIELGNNNYLVTIERAKFIYWFRDGLLVCCE